MNTYSQNSNWQNYLKFLDSTDGKIQQQLLLNVIMKRLQLNKIKTILDAACGSGWLAGALSGSYVVEGCDNSSALLGAARQSFPGLRFSLADVEVPLPYPADHFDAVVLNMAAHDVSDQVVAFQNLFKVTKRGGKLIATIVNPYYAFPVGEWKRGITGKLLNKKPRLMLREYFTKARKGARVTSNKNFDTRFYSLPDTLNHALAAGFHLNYIEELGSDTDDSAFTLQYQLFRFPLLLLLEFEKPAGQEISG